MDNNNDLLFWKLGQMNAAKGYAAAAKGKGGISMSAGEIAIRAGNTVAWYDFTDATTLTDDGGGLISSWRDKLLSGRDLAAAGAARPTLTATGILFNGINNEMSTNAFTYDQPEFIYLVLNQKTWAAWDGLMDGLASSSGSLLQHTASPGLCITAGTRTPDNNDLAINTYGIIRIFFQGADSYFMVNTGIATAGITGLGNMGGITLGRGVANPFGNVEFKEAIFRNIEDDAATQTSIYNYLSTKYSI